MPPTRRVQQQVNKLSDAGSTKLDILPSRPRKSSTTVKKSSTPKTSKRKPFLTATSPRKTRGVHRKDEDLECEVCGQSEPYQQLFNCPNCSCVFHLTSSCVWLEPETSDYFRAHPNEWRCPRCVPCSACEIYVHDPANVQCVGCGRAFHGGCRPKNAPTPVYPFNDWRCDRCAIVVSDCRPSAGSSRSQLSSQSSSPRKVVAVGIADTVVTNTPSKKTSPRRKPSFTKFSPASKSRRNSREAVKLEFGENKKPILAPSNVLLLSRSANNLDSNNRKGAEDTLGGMAMKRKSDTSLAAAETPRRRGRRQGISAKAVPKTEPSDGFVDETKINKESSDFSLAGKMALQKMNVLNQWVYFGQDIRYKPIYESSYPPHIANAPNVYICDFCFRALADICQFRNHLTFCRWQHPPGNEIYREGHVSIWEVEGCEETTYCRNLCLLSKFFLSSKTLYHEVETFTFYVLTEITDHGCVLAGYFSKEKNPSKNNNLSCLLTLPAHQRKGYGKMLIDLSYQLSKREHKIGSPEHPLSDVGLITYRSYWRSVIVSALRRRRNSHAVSIKDLSIETAVHSADIISTLLALGAITFRNDGFAIDTNLAFNASLSSFRRRTIDESLLVWEPSFDVVPGNKMNSYAAD